MQVKLHSTVGFVELSLLLEKAPNRPLHNHYFPGQIERGEHGQENPQLEALLKGHRWGRSTPSSLITRPYGRESVGAIESLARYVKEVCETVLLR